MTGILAKPARLDRASRRAQLLATARTVVAERGVGGFTMEALAAAAGVNKALPYRHFDNADAVLDELFRTFNVDVGTRVLRAARAAAGTEARVRAVIRAYLDCVIANADLLVAVASPSATARTPFEDPRAGIRFAAELLTRQFGFAESDAWATASIVQGALAGGAEGLAHREARRPAVEEALVTALSSLVDRYGS